LAKSLQTTNGTLAIPGAYASYSVQNSQSGLATTGVLMLVGEAAGGPDFTTEQDLELNAFGPDQASDVVAKYGSGPIVDAFNAACSPANDPDITGSFNSCILVKTNVGAKASGALPKVGGGNYATLFDKSYGKGGNAISFRTVAAQSEVAPTTGLWTYIPPVGSVDYRIRVNGGVALGTTIAAATLPPALVSALGALSGLTVAGGVSRGLITAAGGRTVAVTAFPAGTTATTAIFTISASWDATPVVGDTFILPLSAPVGLRGAGDANVGAWVVTAASALTVTAVKLSDFNKGSAVPGTVTVPITVGATALAAATDVQAYSPVSVSVTSGAVINGAGKALELAELATGTDLLSRIAYVLGTVTPVSWVSKSASPALLVSGAEFEVELDTSQSATAVTEQLVSGGEVGLTIGFLGTSGTLTIGPTTLTTTVVGGTNLTLNLADYTNVQNLADYINSIAGYSCSVGTAALGNLPVGALDQVTAIGIASQFATKPGRVKTDAYRFFQTISGSSVLVQLGFPPADGLVGLPDVMAAQVFMAGGSKGGTSNAQVQAAYAALQNVQGNFLVPLFARDASLDIADGSTDAASSYTISAIHAGARSHVLAMSTLKARKNRQTVLAIESDFVTQRNVAANIASFRACMAFEDFKQTNSDGSIGQFQPWMGAVLAAAMQAAGFYKNIEFKGINTSGVLSRAGDFNPKNDGQVEAALKAGLLVARPAAGGGFIFVSDQTTYGRDNNFVFNSMQAVYAADICSMTMAQRMEAAIVGQSVADISAPAARAIAEGVFAELMRLKLIAPSDDAPKGFKNLTIRIQGNAMQVSAEIKLATAIDFVNISFLVSQVVQTA
jgi:hypothetical protein